MIFKVSLNHQAFALSSPKQMKYTDIKRGLVIQGTSTSIDLSPDLKPSYGIAFPRKNAIIQKSLQKLCS